MWKQRRVISVAVVLAASAAPVFGQEAFQSLPGWDRYRAVNQAVASVMRSGSIRDVAWSDDGATVDFVRTDGRCRFNLVTRELTALEDEEEGAGDGKARRPARRRGPGRGRQMDRARSPDGAWIARCQDWNVVLEPADDGEPVAVTTVGNRKFRYGKASWVYGEELDQTTAMWWSPDSRRLAFYEFDERSVPDFMLAKGLTKLRPEVLAEGYPKPGEANPVAGLLVYDLRTNEITRIQVGGDPDQYVYNVRFTPDGSELLFSRTNRHQDVLEVLAADLQTGLTRVVVRETQPCWQENRPEMRFLSDGLRFIWETERSGWRHYELRNLRGDQVATLTRGEHPTRSIVLIDEDAGWMYYEAYSGTNPLNVQLHRVRLDGTDATRLTRDRMTHGRFRISPDHRWFICQSETISTPPITALYDMSGQRIAVLAEADASELADLDLEPPELFTFKADDGETDLYGVLFRPSGFDPNHRYPLVIDVYGGPLSKSIRNTYRPAYAYCEFGFLIAKMENRGTTGRGKAFETAAYQKLGDVDLRDQVDGVRFLAQRPYVDEARVGIFGHSYGGYMSALAVLKYPEVFQVAVAGAPVTDWRNYDTIYTERFMRTPQENESGYDNGSCLQYVDQLQGKLLLLHGMVDDNVHPNNTWQLVDKLQQAGKSFDLMFWPRGGHGLGKGARELRWEYLYEHLIESAPSSDTGPTRAP